jgi:ATP-dependent Lhr-like helicase
VGSGGRLQALQQVCPGARRIRRSAIAEEGGDPETACARLSAAGSRDWGRSARGGSSRRWRWNAAVERALAALQQEGFVIQGNFTTETAGEWCERGLLARIHRYTLKQLRSEIEPVAPADFMRFLFRWQGLDDPGEGEAALARTLGQLEGLSLPAACWEDDVLPARVRPYARAELDGLCSAGQVLWLPAIAPGRAQAPRPGSAFT